jgi:hypothetical protein
MRIPWGVWMTGLCLAAGPSLADRNHVRLSQLGNPIAGAGFNPRANSSFRIFARELGAALTSTNLTPPETTGHSGFAFNLELSVADLQPGGNFTMPTESAFNGPLLLPSVHIRKGLPFSFELGTRIAWIDRSRMFAATGEVKWALNEGFQYIPDLGVRVFGTRLINSRDFELTAAGLDLGLGKKFALAGMMTLTPYGGWNLVWVSAHTNLIDFRPGRTQAEATATPTAQLEDASVYEELTLGANSHNRFYLGLRFVGGVVQLTGEISYATLGQVQVPDPADPSQTTLESMPRVLSYNMSMGMEF